MDIRIIAGKPTSIELPVEVDIVDGSQLGFVIWDPKSSQLPPPLHKTNDGDPGGVDIIGPRRVRVHLSANDTSSLPRPPAALEWGLQMQEPGDSATQIINIAIIGHGHVTVSTR